MRVDLRVGPQRRPGGSVVEGRTMGQEAVLGLRAVGQNARGTRNGPNRSRGDQKDAGVRNASARVRSAVDRGRRDPTGG